MLVSLFKYQIKTNTTFVTLFFSSVCIMSSKHDKIREQRENLPTFEYKQDLIEAIREYNVLVVIGETGTIFVFRLLYRSL